MIGSGFGRYAIGIGAALVLLAGCGGSQSHDERRGAGNDAGRQRCQGGESL